MITRAIRDSMKHREGQALVIACLMMLVVSLAVLATVHLGHGIHERIRLQNTADASSYSSAAAEARAFNYYAFSNRTQASHYVSAMVWHSINSFTYFTEAFLTDTYGLALSVSVCSAPSVILQPVCTVLEALPYVGEFMQVVDASMSVFEGIVTGYQSGIEALNPDFFLSGAVRLHRTVNQTLMVASTAVMEATLAPVLSMSSSIVSANDPNIGSTLTRAAVFGSLSACMLDRAHMREAGGSPFAPTNPFTPLPRQEVAEDSKVARAKRSMAQIANASRFACDTDSDTRCPETFVTNRSFSAVNPLEFLGPAVKFFEAAVPKVGQTRMLSYRLGKGTNSGVPGLFAGDPDLVDAEANNHIRTYNTPGSSPVGAIAQGDVIGSDDLWWLKPNIPFLHCDATDDPRYCFGDNRANNQDYSRMVKTSIWSMGQGDHFDRGVHYRLLKPGRRKNGQFHEKSNVGLNLREELWGALNIYSARIAADPNDDNHEWDGLVPFNHFEPGQFADACNPLIPGRHGDASGDREATRRREFNQPSTFTLLSKSPEELRNPQPDPTGATRTGPARLNDEGKITLTLGDRTSTLDFDDEVPTLVLGEGMHALSRAQAYYHRPGNWAEQPNFFNPYWRPRLAPVLQARDQIPLLDESSRSGI